MALTDAQNTILAGLADALSANGLTGDALGKFLAQAGLLVQIQSKQVAIAAQQAANQTAQTSGQATIQGLQANINTLTASLQALITG